jgi:hypothetical protein
MDPAVDVSKLGPVAGRVLDPKSPAPMRQMAARGAVPGLKPSETLTVIAILSESEDEAVATTAKATLAKLPPQLVSGITPELQPGVVDALATRYATDLPMMEKLLALPQIPLATVAAVAQLASESVAELIATNEERLLKHPAIIEKLYLNKATRMSTADRMIELAVRNKIELTGIPAFKEAAAAIGEELIAEASEEPNYDDIQFKETERIAAKIQFNPVDEDTHQFDETTGEEVAIDKVRPLYAQLAELSISKKIRRAQIGSAADRMILVRDSDRRVAVSAVKNPNVQEAEIVRISSSRAVSEDVLRVIAMSREWTRSHQIKLNLVSNPRCPFAFAAKLVPHLRDHELKNIARSKNVTGSISQAAKQQLERKGIKM